MHLAEEYRMEMRGRRPASMCRARARLPTTQEIPAWLK